MSKDDEFAHANGDRPDTAGAGDDGRGHDRPFLPPPAFPPGPLRAEYRRRAAGAEGSRPTPHPVPSDEPPSPEHDLSGAFIAPDDPMPDRDPMESPSIGPPESAFISPDDPFPQRAGGTVVAAGEQQAEEGRVTGMGDDPHLGQEEMAAGGDPFVLEIAHKVGKLAQALAQKGEAGLHTTPEMDRFESTLRGYCVGYLAGRRAEDEV